MSTDGVRRIVTGHDASDRAVVWLDGPAANVKHPTDFLDSTLLWATDASPAAYLGDDDAGEWRLGTAPPANGSRFIRLSILPGEESPSQFHRSDTLDYVIGTEGVMTMLLDDGVEVDLHPGEALIQRGTFHAWLNRGTVRATVFIVLLDGAPKRTGSVSGTEQAR
jgi:hypothetical protein